MAQTKFAALMSSFGFDDKPLESEDDPRFDLLKEGTIQLQELIELYLRSGEFLKTLIDWENELNRQKWSEFGAMMTERANALMDRAAQAGLISAQSVEEVKNDANSYDLDEYSEEQIKQMIAEQLGVDPSTLDSMSVMRMNEEADKELPQIGPGHFNRYI